MISDTSVTVEELRPSLSQGRLTHCHLNGCQGVQNRVRHGSIIRTRMQIVVLWYLRGPFESPRRIGPNRLSLISDHERISSSTVWRACRFPPHSVSSNSRAFARRGHLHF